MLIPAILFVIIMLLFYYSSQSKFNQFSSPFCLPILGHLHIFLIDKKIRSDPLNGIWELYKKYQKDGMMYIKTLSLNSVWIGDFDTIKYLFNSNEVTGRLNSKMLELARLTTGVKWEPEIPGVLLSNGQVWQQQRRFTFKTLRDFGFGKQGVYIYQRFCAWILVKEWKKW